MLIWIDLANSPHVATFEPVVERLRNDGYEVALTVRDHAQTLPLAIDAFGESSVEQIGGSSPPGRIAKGQGDRGPRPGPRALRPCDHGLTWLSRTGRTPRSSPPGRHERRR